MFEDLLPRGGLSLDRLHSFCLVAEKGGIAKAVGNDLSRQALISRQIRELEEYFGIELTRRRGRGIEITEAGMDLARIARTTFEGLGDLRAKASGEPIDLRMASGNSVLEWFLIPEMKRIGNAAGGVRIELFDLRTDETVRGLIEHTVDIGIVRESAVVPPLKFRLSREVGYQLFIPKREARKWRDVSSVPLAMALGGEFCKRATTLAEKAGVHLNIRWRCTSFTQAARLVEEGLCAAILPEIAATRLQGCAVTLDLPWLTAYRRRIGYAWHQRLVEARPSVARLLALLT